jgi:hypothetical protein
MGEEEYAGTGNMEKEYALGSKLHFKDCASFLSHKLAA